MSGLVRLLAGAILCLAMSAPELAAGPPGAIMLEIQHTKPTYIVWSAVRFIDGRAVVTGRVRHRAPPGRNGIYGHVVATVEASATSGENRSEIRIDVPLVPLAKPRVTAREAKFSFTLPAVPGDHIVVRLCYVKTRMPKRA